MMMNSICIGMLSALCALPVLSQQPPLGAHRRATGTLWRYQAPALLRFLQQSKKTMRRFSGNAGQYLNLDGLKSQRCLCQQRPGAGMAAQ